MASLLQKFKKKKSGDPSKSSKDSKKQPNKNSGPPSKSSSIAASATSSEVRGILKNKADSEKYHNADSYPTSEDLDESLRNARKNMSINLNVTKDNKSKETTSSQNNDDNNILNNDQIDETTTISEPLPSNAKETASDENIESMNNNNDNESKNDNNDTNTDNDITMDDKNKDVLWDEDNLRKNEEEKIPRMKIDEAPTPYHDMPAELLDDSINEQQPQQPMMDDNEEILDMNPMDMIDDNDDDDGDIESRGKSVESVNSNNSNEKNSNQKELQQQRQAALLQDADYQNKMINDALKRRDNDATSAKKPKKIVSAWEDDTTKDSTMGSNDDNEETDNSVQKKGFNQKRSAHYNEFYAVKAMKAKMEQEDNDA